MYIHCTLYTKGPRIGRIGVYNLTVCPSHKIASGFITTCIVHAHIRFSVSLAGITTHTVVHVVHVRFWPTLHVVHVRFWPTLLATCLMWDTYL